MGFAIPDNHNKLLRSFLVSAGLVVLAVAAQQAVQLAFNFDNAGASSAGAPDPDHDPDKNEKGEERKYESKREQRNRLPYWLRD